MRAIAFIPIIALSACVEPAGGDVFDRLAERCGRAYEGEVVSEDPRDADMAGERLVMHIRECSADELRIPFHVGENRSRTWVITRVGEGLRLKHDHRHRDGSEDALSWYGGDAEGPVGRRRAEFPADEYSRELFEREGIPESAENVWSITVTDEAFVYALDRPDRRFEARFDLTAPVDAPPPPWGVAPVEDAASGEGEDGEAEAASDEG
ncbi:hypothetical protein [Marinicauda salina]|uniref:hypothetical protein n=1 Tax=Marinicauda salina TaxID=2135793 RepID=UPI0018EE9160|nr:hypothetical protein [Marinicauda salina]